MTGAGVDEVFTTNGGWLRVGDAVRALGRTERAVRRYVAGGTLESRRVGSQLQISEASVLALAASLGIDRPPEPAPAVTGPAAAPPPVPPRPGRPERPGRATAGGDESRRSFTDLGAWKELSPLVTRAAAALSREPPAGGAGPALADRALANLWGAAEAVAGGFAGFPASAKAEQYACARRLVLAAAADLALLAAGGGAGAAELRAVSADLEAKAARALTGLVRAMERRTSKRTPGTEERDGWKEPQAGRG